MAAVAPGAQRVVVADDSRLMRRILSDALGRRGFDVVATAADGDEALAACNEHRPDAMTLDLAMPGTDGFALAERLCRESRRRPLLVAVTGLSTDADRDHTRAAGFDHHLVKPAKLETLRAVLAAGRAK